MDDPTWCYCIEVGDHVKIGISNDPWRRAKQLTTPYVPEVLYAIRFNNRKTACEVEEAMHNRYANYQAERGEFFAAEIHPWVAWDFAAEMLREECIGLMGVGGDVLARATRLTRDDMIARYRSGWDKGLHHFGADALLQIQGPRP